MANRRIAPGAEGFNAVGSEYERSRASYPPEAVELVAGRLELRPDVRVCDVGAGTGKLTRLLIETGAEVVAVEPVRGMRDRLEATIPWVEVVDAIAERLPFSDGDFDAVTVAQAFHWFRAEEALAELGRVLRPGGGLAILHNDLDERIGWVRQLDEIGWPAGSNQSDAQPDWEESLVHAGFRGTGRRQFEWVHYVTRIMLAERVRSSSSVALEPADVQQGFVDQVLALVEGLEEPIEMPYVTHVWWGYRSGERLTR